MPASQIHYLLRNQGFSEVRDLLEDYPGEARILNSARSAPIAVLIKLLTCGMVEHAVDCNARDCVINVLEAFDALLEAHPRGVENVDKRGDTALIIACRDGRLVSAGRDTNPRRATKILLWAVDRMIDACPSAVSVPDQHGTFALGHVCDMGSGPMEIIGKLARVYPDALLARNLICDMVSFFDLFWDRIDLLLGICPRTALEGSPTRRLWNQIKSKYVKKSEPHPDLVPTTSPERRCPMSQPKLRRTNPNTTPRRNASSLPSSGRRTWC